jgi:hypothetical protein
VTASVVWSSGSGPAALQKVLVQAMDPDPPHPVLATITVYKTAALTPQSALNTASLVDSSPTEQITQGCSQLVGN